MRAMQETPCQGKFHHRDNACLTELIVTQCDESKPRCVNCQTADVQCQYLTREASDAGRTALDHYVQTPSNTSITSEASTLIPDRQDNRPEAPSPFPAPEPTGRSELIKLELLHHWTTVTYATLTPEKDQQEMWQTTAVKIGLSYPFLLHEIMAIAALHLSKCKPERREFYHTWATELQTSALTGFNSVEKQVNESNCAAVLLFSSLLGVHLLADRPSLDDVGLSDYLDHLIKYTGLTRSVRSLVISEWWPFLRDSEIKPLTQVSVPEPKPPYDNVLSECRKLRELTRESDLQPSMIETYEKAIDRLFWLFEMADVPTATHVTIRWVIAWPVQLPEEYILLLQQRRPEALIILAYYGVALHSYRKAWSIGDSGRTLIKAVSAQVGNYWSRWLQWPLEMVDGT